MIVWQFYVFGFSSMEITSQITRSEASTGTADSVYMKDEPLPRIDTTYTISARAKPPEAPVFGYLRTHYGNIPLREIDSLFGFVEQSELYGGRPFRARELSERDVENLNSAGIGIRLPLTNHFVERREYENNRPLLDKYHVRGNFVIVTNDDLAKWIRRDFPLYNIDASVIKNIKTHRKIDQALTIYDSVVLPMRVNEDLEFLDKIKEKDRITLFANAGCALTCPSKLCYPSISRINKGTEGEVECSQSLKSREQLGMVSFKLQIFVDLGFHRYKLLRSRPDKMTGH
jgi:hypothetical protein